MNSVKVPILDFIDFNKVDALLEGFNKSTGFVTAILDLDGKVLSKSGWRQICTEFHRINPDTSKKCTISDTELANRMAEGEKYHFYECLNGLVDVAVPIVINGEQIANLFTGQFFFEKPDFSFFKNQAKKYGFDEDKYIEALKKVPVVSENKVKTAMDFLLNMTQLISEVTFQKLEQAELIKSISESEEKFKAVFESANVGKSITLPTGELNANEAFCKMLGYTSEELKGKKWQDITPEDEIPSIQKKIAPLLKNKKDTARFEKRYICKNGTHIWADVSTSILRDVNHEPLFFITTVIDITEHKQAEVELKMSEKLFSSAFHHGPTGITITRIADGKFIDVNESFCKMFEFERDEMIGHTSTELSLWTPEERKKLIQQQISSGGLHNFELLARTKTGKLINVLFSSTQIELKDEACHITTMIDITDRKQAEEERWKSDERFRIAQDMSPDGFTILKPVRDAEDQVVDFTRVYENEAAAKWNGTVFRGIEGKRLLDLFPDHRAVELMKVYKQVAESGEPLTYEEEYSGELMAMPTWFRLVIVPMRENIAILSQDITEQKRTHEALRRSENHLKRALDSIPDVVVIYDKELKIQFINTATRKVTGRPESDFIGKREEEIWPPEVYQIYLPVLEEVVKTGDLRYLDTEVTFPNGDIRSLRITCVPLLDENGAVVEVMGVTNDYTDRKLAEDTIKISRERLLFATEGANLGIWNWNIETGELIWSDKSKQFFGLEPDVTMSYQRFIEGLHPDDREKTNRAVKDSLENHKDFDIEYRALWPDSSLHWIGAKGRGFYDKEGNPVRMEGVLIDISERKQAEEKLEESERDFRSIFENASIGIAMIESETGRFLRINQSYCDMVKYSLKEILSLDFLQITHPDDLQEDLENMNRLKTGQLKTFSMDKRYLAKDGEIVWANLIVIPLEFENDKMITHMALVTDITERKQAEKEMIRTSRIMSNSQEIAHLGSFEYVAATQTTIWSEEEYRIYGLDPNGPSPKYNEMLEKCIHPADAQLLHDTFMTAVQSRGEYELVHRIIRPNGSVRWVHDKAQPYFDETGNLLRYVGATLDITESKLLQEELEIMNSELEKKVKQRTVLLESANKELEAFSYSVSHDLRAPLRHISGYVDLLNKRFRDKLPGKAEHYLKEITDSARQMGKLIDDLLRFSRTGRQELRLEDMDMNAIVHEVLEKLKPDAGDRKITWTVAELPRVFGDYSLMKQVWINLLENAVKYTKYKDEALIEVGYTRESHQWEFFVRDNGVGFSMQYSHKLFGVFQRLHSADHFEGTGIGLANVKRIILKHGGQVRAEGRPNEEAVFYFTIPEKTIEKGRKS